MQSKRIVGTPGGGKTHLMVEDALKAFDTPEIAGDWSAIGFSSLTKAARSEASERFGAAIGVDADKLQKQGWFRTTHSAVFRLQNLTANRMLGDKDKSRAWFEDAFGVRIAAGYDEDGNFEASGDVDVAESLRVYHLSRVTFSPIRRVRDYCYEHGDDVPPEATIRKIVAHYEHCKRKTKLLDFDDILASYAGWEFQPDGTATRCEPIGALPEGIRLWILDEAQDSSPLLAAAQQRMMTAPGVRWAWIGGDPNQTINEWNGADPQMFLRWPVIKEQYLSKSYRCPRPIMKLARRCLIDTSFQNYTQPAIAPADHAGMVSSAYDLEAALETIRPTQDILVLCRTRQLEAKARAILKNHAIPFCLLRTGKAQASQANIARAALLELQAGVAINGSKLNAVFEHLPAQRQGVRLLSANAKKVWRSRWDGRDVMLDGLLKLGGTRELVESVRNGSWRRQDAAAATFLDAVRRWGVPDTLNPRIRVGTIHSAKGTEADKVVLCTSSSRRCSVDLIPGGQRAREEGRVAYVAATRARRELILARDLGSKFTMELDGYC